MRGILVSALGLGLTGCSKASLNSYGQNAASWNSLSASQGASYFPQRHREAPYVLMAQNNSVPQLRGPQHVRQAILQQYHFDDMPKPYTASPMPAASTIAAPAYRAARPVAAQFKHQLGHAAPRVVSQPQARPQAPAQPHQPAQTYKPAATYNTQAYKNVQAAQAAPAQAYQNTIASTYSAPRDTTSSPVTPSSSVTAVTTADATTMNESLSSALQQSPRLAIEEIKIQEAQEQLEQAKSQGRLKANLEGILGASQNETDFRVIDRTDSDFRVRRNAGLNLSLPLYQGGRINAQKDVAKVDVETAKANYSAVESFVTEQAGIAHLNILRDRALVEVYKRNVALLETQKKTVAAMLHAGENTVTDGALVDARLASIQVSLEQAYSNLSSSESRYKKLTGMDAPTLSPTQEIQLPESLQEAKEVALKNNAQIKSMQSQSEAAYHNIALAKSVGRPKLALQGGLRASEGQSDTIRRTSAAEILLNLSVPLLSGGENKSRVRQAALAQSRSLLETRTLQEDLYERLEQLWATVNAAKQSQAPNLAQKSAAETAYKAIVSQRKAGLVTSLDVIAVEQTLLNAELNILQAENAEGVARLQILGLMGAL